MPRIEIYTTRTCPFCIAAKTLLSRKGVSFEEIDVGARPDLRAGMTQRAGGRRTVPQIFVDGRYLGDCSAVQAMDRAGKLDAALGLAA